MSALRGGYSPWGYQHFRDAKMLVEQVRSGTVEQWIKTIELAVNCSPDHLFKNCSFLEPRFLMEPGFLFLRSSGHRTVEAFDRWHRVGFFPVTERAESRCDPIVSSPI